MPHLALTRAGVESFVQDGPKAACLWIGSDILSKAEVKTLRDRDFELSVFTHPVRTLADIEAALPTLREHHPNELVWIEALPENFNPRSADVGQAFLWREYIAGVVHRHNELVEVVSGSHKGERGSLVSLVRLEPEPEFILEAESGQDIHVVQSSLGRADA